MGCKNVIIIILLFGMFQFGWAQPRLVLLKGDKTIFSFHEGDHIRFKRKDRDHFTAGYLNGLHRDFFRIGEDTTYVYQLEMVDMRGRPNSGFQTQLFGATFIVAGTLLFLGDLFNQTVVSDETYEASTGVIAVSASLIGTGVLMQFVNNNNFKFGRRKKVVVIMP